MVGEADAQATAVWAPDVPLLLQTGLLIAPMPGIHYGPNKSRALHNHQLTSSTITLQSSYYYQ